MIPPNAALLVIDVQQGLDDLSLGARNNPDAEARIARLLEVWRRSGRPVVHVQHLSKRADSPLRPGQPGVEIKAAVRPLDGEKLVQKHANAAFVGTDLERHLRAQGIGTLVVAGLTTDHCVSATARTAGDLGFATYVVADATATFGKPGRDGSFYEAQLIHDTALASLQGEFAEVLDLEELLARL